jgi:hypothetical protein
VEAESTEKYSGRSRSRATQRSGRGNPLRATSRQAARTGVSRRLLLPDGEAISLAILATALGFAPSWLETGATQAHKLRARFAPDFVAEFTGRDAYRELLDGLDVTGQLAGRAALNQALSLWSKVMLPNYYPGKEENPVGQA